MFFRHTVCLIHYVSFMCYPFVFSVSSGLLCWAPRTRGEGKKERKKGHETKRLSQREKKEREILYRKRKSRKRERRLVPPNRRCVCFFTAPFLVISSFSLPHRFALFRLLHAVYAPRISTFSLRGSINRMGSSISAHISWSHFDSSVLEIFIDFYLGFTGFSWVFLGFPGFNRVLQGFTGFYWVLLGFTGFYWVLPRFTWFNRVFP